MDFSELQLMRPLLRAVEEQGYASPSPIQQKAIPPVLAGRDLLGCAQTGTGKTAAFALPMLQRLAARRPPHKKVRALILTPTRELALQIGDSFAALGKYTPITHTVVFGGVGQAPQAAALQRGVDVLVACPGRLNDLIGQGLADLSAVEIFVLDEADRMLDMGFVNDVKKVIRRLPAQRQTLLFSATMPREIEQLAASILRRPVAVKVDPVSSTVERIDQSLYYVAKGDKPALLVKLVRSEGVSSALVFSRTKHGADKIARILNRNGIPAAAIHGNKSQNARVAALEGFKRGDTRVLVATDIAARGIDISELSHVFNFDLPEVAETYVHRIGRTGRAGQDGAAISFCSPEEQEYLAGIEKLNRKRIPVKKAGALPALAAGPAAQPAAASAAPRAARRAQAPGQTPTAPPAPLQAAPAPRRAENRVQSEESMMEEKQKAAAPGEGLSASAKRRRRRRRAAGRAEGAPKKKAEKAPAPAPRKERPAREKAPARPAAPLSEDPGLILISRKPPQQKFQSFEEYLKSHGGATGPIEGEGE